MAPWLTYLRERFPLPVYLVLVAGLCLSGAWLEGGALRPVSFVICFVGLLVFFALLRLMDELKDYEKDRVAHPARPLPRGILSLQTVAQAIRMGVIFMLTVAAGATAFANLAASLSYLVITGYLWLMYREFYCGAWLEKRPVLYAMTHQLVLIPLCYFSVLVSQPSLLTKSATFAYALCVLGAFFAYEVCRKLDPKAHPILRTYLSVYGPTRVFLLVLATMLVAAFGATGLGLGRLLLPLEGMLLFSLITLWLNPRAFKIPETIATVALVIHIWAIPIDALAVAWELPAPWRGAT